MQQFFSGNHPRIGHRCFGGRASGGGVGQVRSDGDIVIRSAYLLLLLGNGLAQTVGCGMTAVMVFWYFGKREAFGIGGTGENR